MTDYYHEAREAARDFSDDKPRRRSTDIPHSLDCPTRELVRDIIEHKPREHAPRKSLLQRLFGLGRSNSRNQA